MNYAASQPLLRAWFRPEICKTWEKQTSAMPQGFHSPRERHILLYSLLGQEKRQACLDDWEVVTSWEFQVPRVQGHAYIRKNLAEAGDQGQTSRSQSRVGTGAEMENGKLRDCCSKGQNKENQTILPGEHGSQIHRGLPAAAF